MSSPSVPVTVPPPSGPLGPGLDAVRRFWKPFVLIQIVALAVVVCYYALPAFAAACQFLAELKERGGLPVAAAASAVAGGLVPELAKKLTGADPRPARKVLDDAAFNTLYFAFAGTAVYFFYLWQSRFWGDAPDVLTTAKKVLTDQLLFTPLYAIPTGLVVFTWRRERYRLAPALRELAPRRLLPRALTLLLPCWAFWVPMTSMIYSLPAGLQFPLFTFALAAWSLILVVIASGE